MGEIVNLTLKSVPSHQGRNQTVLVEIYVDRLIVSILISGENWNTST